MSDTTKTAYDIERRAYESQIERLLGIAEAHRPVIERDPVRYYAMAMDSVLEMRSYIEEIEEAAAKLHTVSVYPGHEKPTESTVEIDAQEYARFQRVMAVIRRGPVKAPPKASTVQ